MTPVIIKPVSYAGSLVSVIWGCCLVCANIGGRADGSVTTLDKYDQPTQTPVYTSAHWPEIIAGLVWVFIVPLGIRIVCETIAAIFQVRDGSKKPERRDYEKE